MATWIKPTEDNLKHEFKVEIQLKGNKFFDSYEQFKQQADKATVVELTDEIDRKISYRSRTSSKQQLINLIRGYRSYPEFRNEQTIENLYQRIGAGETMTMPIVIKFKNGSMRVLGGNTRLDVAFQLGVSPKVLMIEPL